MSTLTMKLYFKQQCETAKAHGNALEGAISGPVIDISNQYLVQLNRKAILAGIENMVANHAMGFYTKWIHQSHKNFEGLAQKGSSLDIVFTLTAQIGESQVQAIDVLTTTLDDTTKVRPYRSKCPEAIVHAKLIDLTNNIALLDKQGDNYVLSYGQGRKVNTDFSYIYSYAADNCKMLFLNRTILEFEQTNAMSTIRAEKVTLNHDWNIYQVLI